jgi:hypothetical protein
MANPLHYSLPPRSPMEALGRMEQQMSALQQQMNLIRHQWNLPLPFMEPRPSPMHYSSPQIMNTAVPLHSGAVYPPSRPPSRFQTRRYVPNRDLPLRRREEEKDMSPYALSDVLQEGEDVWMRIIVGSEPDGYVKCSQARLQFDGSRLVVNECADVPSMVGKTSDKAGALLYEFMNGLLNAGLLRRTFRTAPWKLCFVKRDGVFVSLNKLRKQHV